MKTILIRTNERGFIKIEIEGENITTSMAPDEDVPEKLRKTPVEDSAGAVRVLHPHLVREATELAKCYDATLAAPVEAYLVKSGGSAKDWSEIDAEF